MIRYLIGAAVIATLATPAFAQRVPSIPGPPAIPSYKPPSLPTYGPKTTSTYDPQTGNSYRTTVNPDGSSRTTGYNAQTGSTWNSRTNAQGKSSGVDAEGNYWTYNPRSGAYTSTDGTICTGTGYARTCTK